MTLAEPTLDVTPVAPPATASRSRRRSLLVVVVLVGAVLALLAQGLLHNLDYFETVQQAMSHRATLRTTDFRLEGLVAKGSVQRTGTGADFYLDGTRTDEIFVREVGAPPELFRAGIPVVVDGHFLSDTSTTFVAHQIIVKHTASYIAQHPGRVRAPNGSVR
jgi:cytochrome c-type biogenesis protein CcmE